jgi:hypothetical protein
MWQGRHATFAKQRVLKKSVYATNKKEVSVVKNSKCEMHRWAGNVGRKTGKELVKSIKMALMGTDCED